MRKRQLLSRDTVHGAMGCSIYLVLRVVAFVLVISAQLLLAEWLFPKYVHLFNYSLSSRTFVELKAAHKYKAATDFFEQKKDVFTRQGDKYINMTEVFDCYKRIGEYEKAESVLRDIYNFKYSSEKELKVFEQAPWQKDLFLFSIAKEFFTLYEEMGDLVGQQQYYAVMQEHVTPEVKKQFGILQDDAKMKSNLSFDQLTRIYDLKMLYQDNPDEAISQMVEYLDDIANNRDYGPSFVLKCMNLLVEWITEQHGVLPAYKSICNAVEYALNTDSFNDDKSEYGNLSDISFKIHDIKNSERFYSIYTTFLKGNTSEEDPLFIDNRVRGFKFLEERRDWPELESQVIECCTSLRSLLGKNLQTMSESQREHFVSLLDGPFDYAANLLYEHPSEKLAELCLENSIFLKGLLLRSNRELANKIRNSGDSILVASYNQLIELRKELAYRESLGNVGNAIRMRNLREEIDKLDKHLAVLSEDYRTEQESVNVSNKTIKKAIGPSSAVVDFMQTDKGYLLALVLTKDGSVRSANLGHLSKMLDNFPSDIRQAYSDPGLTNIIWSPVEQYFSGIKDIYYSVNGIFNSISFQALNTGGQLHLLDKYQFHMLSNISNVLNYQNGYTTSTTYSQLAMWGDIDYGEKYNDIQEEQNGFRDIERGDYLRRLIFSKEEIDAIRKVAERNNGLVTVFTGASATESSFRSREGKRDEILHISTHGFFTEDDIHRKDYNPMYNSGLFFAGADSTWNGVDTAFVVSSMIDDGILRADEIQNLDFTGCHIAVLSACKTGRGQSNNREGVYGLQRAFKLAGVDKVLMSLWNVNDRSTSELMQEFYRNYYAGCSDEEALRKAQNTIREHYPSPEDWGAFVLLY